MTIVHRSIGPALSAVLVLALAVPAARESAAAKRSPRAPRDTTMVLIPAGEFVMGREGTGDNSPAHTVRLGAFCLDRYEVTNAEYAAFCKATGATIPFFWGLDRFRSGPKYPDHPVVGINWGQALEYAKWRGKRLPTEAEWEYAARGGLVGMKYVDGNTLDSSKVNFTRSKQDGPVAVGSYPPNGYGIYDVAGNVQEWVADRFDAGYYANSPAEDPRGPEKGRFRVIRGGGWFTGPMCMDVALRYALPGNWVDFNVGFRCARDAAPRPATQGAAPADSARRSGSTLRGADPDSSGRQTRGPGGENVVDATRPEPGAITWMDLTVPDAQRLRDFYAAVAGWKTVDVPMGGYVDFSMIAPGSGKPVAGVCHARGANADLPAQWLIYITVADLDASLERCRALGGALVTGPRGLGDWGRFAVIRDPAGAVAGLIEPPH